MTYPLLQSAFNWTRKERTKCHKTMSIKRTLLNHPVQKTLLFFEDLFLSGADLCECMPRILPCLFFLGPQVKTEPTHKLSQGWNYFRTKVNSVDVLYMFLYSYQPSVTIKHRAARLGPEAQKAGKMCSIVCDRYFHIFTKIMSFYV